MQASRTRRLARPEPDSRRPGHAGPAGAPSRKEAPRMASTTTGYGRVWDRRLGELPDPPSEQLYTRGDRIEQALQAPTVAVIGARACSAYGALDAGGLTVAGLGCGIDRDYPAAHAELARRVATSGGVVSEYEPGVEPAPWRFPARNRIIAALADAVVIVEARARSGALITVDLAMEIGKPIYAVPGEITSLLSEGTNDLLRHGWATALTSALDVLE